MERSSRIVPLKLLQALLPDPAGLGERYRGQICIGCLISGLREGRERTVFIYNLCDHQACYQETGTQAISYAAGVPAVTAALLLAGGAWRLAGVHNVEGLAPRPFLALLPKLGWNGTFGRKERRGKWRPAVPFLARRG